MITFRQATTTLTPTGAEALQAVRAQLSPRDHGPALFAPGGVRAWFDGGELCFAAPDGRSERVRWNGKLPVTLRARGHGFVAWGKPEQWFDLTTRQAMRPDDERDVVFFVRGAQLVQRHRRSGVWLRRDPGSEAFVEVPALANADLLGLVDDERVLCARQSKQACELFVWRPADGSLLPIAVPGAAGLRSLGVAAPMRQQGSLLPRAPDGSLWLTVFDPNREGMRFLRWDPATTAATALPFASSERFVLLLAWPDAHSVLLQEGTTIQHIEVATGQRTQRFPARR